MTAAERDQVRTWPEGTKLVVVNTAPLMGIFRTGLQVGDEMETPMGADLTGFPHGIWWGPRREADPTPCVWVRFLTGASRGDQMWIPMAALAPLGGRVIWHYNEMEV